MIIYCDLMLYKNTSHGATSRLSNKAVFFIYVTYYEVKFNCPGLYARFIDM